MPPTLAGRLFAVGLPLALLPMWTARFFPSQDGPSRLYNAVALAEYWSGNPLYRQFYQINRGSISNWFDHLVLAALVQVFPPHIAEKFLATAFALLFALGLRYALAAAEEERGAWLALFALPLIYNIFLHLGFYNFLLSLALFLFALGYYLRHGGELAGKRYYVFTVLVLALALSHPMTFAALAIPLGALALARRAPLWRPVLCMAAPALALALTLTGSTNPIPPDWASKAALFRGFVGGAFLWVYSRPDAAFGLLFQSLLVVLFLAARPWRLTLTAERVGLSAAALSLLILYAAAPDAWRSFSFILNSAVGSNNSGQAFGPQAVAAKAVITQEVNCAAVGS